MKVASLALPELATALATTGIYLYTGPFLNHIRSGIPTVSENIAQLYRDYEVSLQGDFADFHVSVDFPLGLRRWLRPQALFSFDGLIPFKPLPVDQAHPMLEWGLNWCVSAHAHQYLIIHSAVLEKSGRAVIMPGMPGAGKSTLSAALMSKGWRLLSDELALLTLDSLNVSPLPRPISLKNKSIDIIGGFVPDAVFGRIAHDTAKGSVAHLRLTEDSVSKAQENALPTWIVFPRYQPETSACLTAESKARAFMRLADNAFNYSLLGPKGFQALGRVVDASDCYDFVYSRLEDAIPIFDDLACSPARPLTEQK